MQNQKNNYEIKSFEYSQEQSWLKQLSEAGVVVVKNVLTEDEVQLAINYFWQWLECIGTGIKRCQPQTWDQTAWPGMRGLGFYSTYGGCHTKASWFIRCHQKVKGAFAKIWKTDNLITSFDTFIGWKPWWVNKKWKPVVENLHVDQNPSFKKGLKCVQGMVPLKPVKKDYVGGLMTVPFTNNDQTQKNLCQKYPFVNSSGSDWVELNDKDPYIKQNKGVLVECNAGDLVLWDSRTIHGGKICEPSNQFQQKNKNDFVRLSMTVTMVPRAWAKQNVLNSRKKMFLNRVGLTHWPQQINKSGMGGYISGVNTEQIKYDWPKLEGQILNLV